MIKSMLINFINRFRTGNLRLKVSKTKKYKNTKKHAFAWPPFTPYMRTYFMDVPWSVVIFSEVDTLSERDTLNVPSIS